MNYEQHSQSKMSYLSTQRKSISFVIHFVAVKNALDMIPTASRRNRSIQSYIQFIAITDDRTLVSGFEVVSTV